MNRFSCYFLLAVTTIAIAASPLRAQMAAHDPTTLACVPPPKEMDAKFVPSAAYEWMEVLLEASARAVQRHAPRPTILARTMAITATAAYDAWAAYDDKAVGTRFGAKLRRPRAERTNTNKEIAVAYATARALLDVYWDDQPWILEQMRKHGLDPDNHTVDVTKPEGIGNVTAAAVIAYHHHDGANQLGDEVGSTGQPYSDYTYYAPVNTPEKLNDPNRWQPIPFDDAKGGPNKVLLGFLTPQWYRVKPLALERADQFRPPAPPRVDSDELKKETDEVMQFNASLTPQQKALVEFMRDGPCSTGQSGHWLKFAQSVARRDHNDIDRDVKLFFTVANVANDAFIACWEAKRYYDTSRPWTLVRYYYAGQKILGWGGPGKGVVSLPAAEWHPYSPFTFVTPPFPGYPSGHSTVSGACAKVLELFTGSDNFTHAENRIAGALTEAEYDCATIMAMEGKPFTSQVRCDVELPMPTFSATADMAGLSRVLGGYHIQADNVEGLSLGRRIAVYEWPRLNAYFDGTAKVVSE
jgi:hypothetical protein